MVRCYIFWLAFSSVFISLTPMAKAAETPVSAEFFLQSIEPDPNMTMLYDFLDIYAEEFAACKETGTYLRALSYLAANGDYAVVRDKIHTLERCPKLSETSKQSMRKLLIQSGETVAAQDVVPPASSPKQGSSEQGNSEQGNSEQASSEQASSEQGNHVAQPERPTPSDKKPTHSKETLSWHLLYRKKKPRSKLKQGLLRML